MSFGGGMKIWATLGQHKNDYKLEGAKLALTWLDPGDSYGQLDIPLPQSGFDDLCDDEVIYYNMPSVADLFGID